MNAEVQKALSKRSVHAARLSIANFKKYIVDYEYTLLTTDTDGDEQRRNIDRLAIFEVNKYESVYGESPKSAD